jgi:SH3-like domain-containing protein
MITKTHLFFIILTFALSLLDFSSAKAEMSSVQGDKTSLRQHPDKSSSVLWELNNGFPVEILKRKGEWVNIKDFENDSGWIHKSRISRKSHVIVKANKNEEQSVNIRSSPNTNSASIGNAFYGVVFAVIEKKGSWVQVQHDSGVSGWIKSDLLWGL